MKHKLNGLSQRYLAALRIHLKPGARASLQPAMDLGCQAVAFGLKTLELLRIHRRALVTLDITNGRQGLIQRAELFFIEANTPILETARAARPVEVPLQRAPESFKKHIEQPDSTNRKWQKSVVRRKTTVDAQARNGKPQAKVLKESLQLQKQLRRLTHQALVAQEDERKKSSHELRDEIAQTLLGLNVRLLLLKQTARSKAKGLKNEIASAQRLVVKSAALVRRLARDLDNHRPTLNERTVATI
jgi:signal transduction histidine kinase